MRQVKGLLPDFSYDSITRARFTDADFNNLNRDFKEGIDKIIDDMEINEDNPYYLRAEKQSVTRQIISKKWDLKS